MRNKKAFILLLTITGSIVFLSRCVDKTAAGNDARGIVYAGSSSCRQCHQSIFDAYTATNHYMATRPAAKKDILGSFNQGQNTFSYSPDTKIDMEERDSGLYQVVYTNGKEASAHRFDVIFGAKHAQTFLYWQGNKTFELPVSYYTSIKAWAASPGFSSSQPNFSRFVGQNCYECHSSYIDTKLSMSSAGVDEELDRKSLIYGIDCERCHGPAINHVNFHLAYADIKQAKYIVSNRSLTRQQQLDRCAVCHSGNDRQKEISTFRFKPGDTLANFYSPWPMRKTSADIDVHGKQYQLLAESKCFIGSKTMTCTTCHDPHQNASSSLAGYSARCKSCHANVDHPFAKTAVSQNEIRSNCIDCHMPEQPSHAITFRLAGSNMKSAYMLRTHKIAVYQGQGKTLVKL